MWSGNRWYSRSKHKHSVMSKFTSTTTPASHSPPTTRWAQTSNPQTNRPVQYSIDRTDKHLYNTVYSHYTHTHTNTHTHTHTHTHFILSHFLQCRKPYVATQHLMLLMMGVCTRNMSSSEYINKITLLHQFGISNYIIPKFL